MSASEKEHEFDLQFGTRNETINEDEIIEVIDTCLNRLGKGVAYTVYLNWSAVDRKKHLGILGDPRSFRTSLFGLFGDEQGTKIETYLVMKLSDRFPIIRSTLSAEEGRDFVLVVNWLARRAREYSLLAEEEIGRSPLQNPAFIDSIEHFMDSLGKWFTEEDKRLRAEIRSLSSKVQREDLEKEVIRIRSDYDGAIDRQRNIMLARGNQKSQGHRDDTRGTDSPKDSGTRLLRESNTNFLFWENSTGEDRILDPLTAIADALNASSELRTLAKRVERMKADIAKHTGSQS